MSERVCEPGREIRLPVVSFFMGAFVAAFVSFAIAYGDEPRTKACHAAIENGADRAVLMAVCR
jgi:hypothetical protein